MNSLVCDVDKALGEAFHLITTGNIPEGERIYQEIRACSPDNPEATHMLGMIASEKGNMGLGRELLTRAIELHPEPPSRYFFNLAILLEFQQEYTAAIPLFKQALALRPTSVTARCRLGRSLQKTGDYSGALICYQKAMALAPDMAEAHYCLGSVLEEQGLVAGAMDAYRQALARQVDSIMICSLMGKAFNRHGCKEEALACYRLALTFHKENVNEPGKLRSESNLWLRHNCGSVRGKVLSVGSGNDSDKEGGLYCEYFTRSTSYTRLDMDAMLFPDLVGDIQDLSSLVADESFDVVFSVWALEHVPNVEMAVAEIHRVLSPRGLFIFGLPLNLEYHSYPDDFHRFTKAGIGKLLAGKFLLARVKTVGPTEQFTLDQRLRLYGDVPVAAPHGHVGIAHKI